MIRVHDCRGEIHEYDGDGDFETEDVTGNLIVTTPTHYVCFADKKWVLAEKVADG